MSTSKQSTSAAPTTVSGRALAVWLCGCAVYVMAVAGRTSFGVAGVAAIDRFGLAASQLALFITVQVGVYALAQVPAGIVIDRFGPRKLLFSGAVLMAFGQVIMGLTTSFQVAVAARVLIGLGDTTAFLSVMRLLPQWFPLRKAPVFAQITGTMGQLGQIISAVPFLAVLGAAGWTTAFLGLGACGIIVAVAAVTVVRDRPQPAPQVSRTSRVPLRQALSIVVRDPVVWQGLFTHWTNMVLLTVFSLLWGTPLMKLGMGLSVTTIGTLLSVIAVTSVCSGPLHGVISARMGRRRESFSLAVAGLNGVVVIAFFLPASPPSVGWLFIWAVVLALLIPASGFGFDSIRESVDNKVVATATGFANMGGFISTMVAGQLVGIILDQFAQPHGWSEFRIAWWAVIGVWAIGMVGFVYSRWLVNRRATPLRTAAEG
ncbi:MAG: MFS transporter [Corynebacterium sp.]|uniref:MFS transporter n=1 Tax=Corynebacterium sp. TaxID=1720 RepID=UPI0026DAAE76|nr:MFS transporter [Corynebacterium sp.]MDO5097850.1 MFS transporter [Corynebacterium sp.]